MDRLTFAEHFAEIASHVISGGKSTEGRRRARVLVIREEPSKEALGEIWTTPRGHVIRYRDGRHELNTDTDSFMPWRRGDWTLEPLTGDRRQMFEMFSRTEVYGINAGKLLDWMAKGRRVLMVVIGTRTE